MADVNDDTNVDVGTVATVIKMAVHNAKPRMRAYGRALKAMIDALMIEQQQFTAIEQSMAAIENEPDGDEDDPDLPVNQILVQRLAQLMRQMGDEQLAEIDANTAKSFEQKRSAFGKLYPNKSALLMAYDIARGARNSPVALEILGRREEKDNVSVSVPASRPVSPMDLFRKKKGE
jgi:hypothetical protein